MNNRLTLVMLLLAVGVTAGSGCGRSRQEIERERLQIEAEKQAQKDMQQANKAIGEIGKKLGRKVPPVDLGLPPEKKKDEPAPSTEAPRKP